VGENKMDLKKLQMDNQKPIWSQTEQAIQIMTLENLLLRRRIEELEKIEREANFLRGELNRFIMRTELLL
jgi:hypothetical protein